MPPSSYANQISEIESWLEAKLPADYANFLATHKESLFGDRVLIYEVSSLQERNETYQTKKYCPGYIAIGDDSGGRAVVISVAKPLHQVFLVGMGYMDPDGFKLVPLSFFDWLKADCPID